MPEVGLWLQFIHLGDYRVKFIENFISGIELLDLTEEDIISLGVSAMGHRKKLLARIKELNKRENGQLTKKKLLVYSKTIRLKLLLY